MGSPRFRTLETDAFSVTEAWFPPGAVLEPHTHGRSILATMVDGSFETVIHRRRLDCSAGAIWTEPCEERHANYIGPAGARALVVQPTAVDAPIVAPFDRLTGEIAHLRHGWIVASARRLLAELGDPDAFTPLVADALVVEMVVTASRLHLRRRDHHEPPPAWLLRAREMVHDSPHDAVRLGIVAAEVGVTPWRLARGFRRHFGTSIGSYARSRRLDWALDQLLSTDAPISEIAHAAGYADQAHFTRACRAAIGVGPGEYRRRAAGSRQWRPAPGRAPASD